MRRAEGFLAASLPDRATGPSWRWWLTVASVLAGLSLPAEPLVHPGKFRIDLEVENPGDSTSGVKSWPRRGDVATDPQDLAAEEIAWQTLESVAGGGADPATSDVVPRLGQGAEEFIENLARLLAAKGFVLADGFDIFTEAPPAKIRFGLTWAEFTPDIPVPIPPTCFEVWARTDLLSPESPALRWPIRQLAADPVVQALLQSQGAAARPPARIFHGATTPSPWCARQPQRGRCGSSKQSVVRCHPEGEISGLAAAPTIPENFVLVILPADGPWLRAASAGPPGDVRFVPIFAVAVACAEEALRQKALAKDRTPTNRTRLESSLARGFDQWRITGEIGFGHELSAVDDAYNQPGNPAWVMRLSGFNPVRRQTVSIGEIQLGNEGRQSWSGFLARQRQADRDLGALIVQKAALEEKLSRLLDAEHPWGAPHFPDVTELTRRADFLRRQSGVAGVDPRIFRGEAAYLIAWQPVLTTLEASGTYNSDRGGNLSARLAVQTRDFGLGVEGFVANRRRGLFADLSTTPKGTSLPDHATTSWGLFGDYTTESPVLFGTPKAFELTDEKTKGGLRWQMQGGSARESAAIRSRRWKIDVSAGYRHARLTGENAVPSTTPDGEAPFAAADFVSDWEHGRSPARRVTPPFTGFLRIELKADASPASGATSRFARGQFSATEEIQFTVARLENPLVRLTVSGGAATSDTPLAWWFRLGGDERMRGFEIGELTGRSFRHAACEAGVGVGTFLRRPADNSAAAPAPRFDFRQIRLLAGIEHARLGETPVFVPATESVRGGWSYSLTAEYGGPVPGLPGNSKLAIGYGYAPGSSHRKGRVFVSLRVPLSLPQPP